MTRTLLVRNKQPQHSLPGRAHKQTSSVKKIRRKCTLSAPYVKKIRRKCATVAPYSMLYRFSCNAVQQVVNPMDTSDTSDTSDTNVTKMLLLSLCYKLF
jgi:hypothetical protein